jgi:hypothetical protein
MIRLRSFLTALALALAPLGAYAQSGISSPTFNPDSAWCATQGSIAIRDASAWNCLPPGSSGNALVTGGAGANPSWVSVGGTGTVTSVGLALPSIFSVTGSPVTGTGTLTGALASQAANLAFLSPNGSAGAPTFRSMALADLPSIAAGSVLANVTGGAAVPTAATATAILDNAFSSTQGSTLYRNAAGWVALPPGTSGQVLTSAGAAANPSWSTVSATSFANQTANTIFAGPSSGGAASPGFRAMVNGDFPSAPSFIGSTTLCSALATNCDAQIARNGVATFKLGVGSATATSSALQLMRIDSANFETGNWVWNGTNLDITTSAGGTGTVRPVRVFAGTGAATFLGANAGTQWQVDTSGHFKASTDNTVDIGQSGANRPRNVYVAGNGTFGGSITVASCTGCSSGGPVLLQTCNASAVATCTFTGLSSSYNSYEFRILDAITTGTMSAFVSTNGGSSYVTSNYYVFDAVSMAQAASYSPTISSTGMLHYPAGGCSGGVSGFIRLNKPSSTNVKGFEFSNQCIGSPTTAGANGFGNGSTYLTTSAVDTVQFQATSITGTIQMWGYP